jgi:hypothetical protein
MVPHGFSWWSQLPLNWGPETGIWFASHAIKQIYVSHLERAGPVSGAFAQDKPLCKDCRPFLARASLHYQAPIRVSVPDAIWHFSEDGKVEWKSKSSNSIAAR